MKSDAQSHLVVLVDDLVAFWVFLFVSVLALFIILSHVRVPRKLQSGSFSIAVHLPKNPCLFMPSVMNLSPSVLKQTSLLFDMIWFCS